MMPFYSVRHLVGDFEEFSCLLQLEDEYAAMYFNMVHGARARRRFTTQVSGEPCADYLLVATEFEASEKMSERKIRLFDLAD